MNKIISSKKGFTLVEILFVLLIIALIVSFALPAFRAVRYDIKNSRAKAALKKLAEARRTFYQNTKGWSITDESSFTGGDAKTYATATCNNPSTTGVPGSKYGTKANVSPAQLFACGFLDWRDFADLPYRFYMCKPTATTANTPCNAIGLVAAATGTSKDEAGKKYEYVAGTGKYWMRIASDTMRVKDSDDED